jgi:hypothetical protein
MATTLGKNVPNYGLWRKSCSQKDSQNFGRNVGETEQHLLGH